MTFNRELSKLGQYVAFTTTSSSPTDVVVSFGATESSTSLFVEKELLDHLGYAGTTGDVLTSTGAGVSWSSLGSASQGTQGTQGIQGIQGAAGVGTGGGSQGIQGTQGTQGTIGSVGVQGIQGAAGVGTGGGTQGTQGIQGITGSVGVQGIQGVAGVGTGGGGSIASRTIATATILNSGVGSTSNITITGYKTYALLKAEVSVPAWVTLYCDTSSRTADSSRLITEDPAAGSGVIAEVITTSTPETVLFTPTTIGFNNDGTPSSNIYAKVVNRSGIATSISVSLTIVQLES